MRRKPNRTVSISTHNGRVASSRDANEQIEELRKQVATLARGKIYLGDDGLPELKAEFQRKRGPVPAFGDYLYRERDQIIFALECYWPEIEPHCYPTLNVADLRTALVRITTLPRGSCSPYIERLLEHFTILESFLRTDRFRGDPRQIANAMAGVPRLSFWRSLKLCQKNPCVNGINPRAIRAYVRRKHPRLYANLELDPKNLVHFVNSLKHYDTREPNMWPYKRWPARLYEAWPSPVWPKSC